MKGAVTTPKLTMDLLEAGAPEPRIGALLISPTRYYGVRPPIGFTS